jgi:hypothetical protein
MKRKRFEGRWLREDNMGDIVETAWMHSPPDASVMAKLSNVHSKLHEWDHTALKAPQKKMKELTKELELLLAGPMSEDSTQ